MKALIPVAGVGTRLRPHTHTQPKPLIPVAGKPIIGFIIEELLEVGIRDFVFVIGYLGEKIQQFIEENYPDIQSTFIQQTTRMGSGHAIWVAKDALRDADELLIVYGDTIFDVDWKTFLNTPHSCLGIKKVDDPRDFGVADIQENDLVKSVEEKPNIPLSNKALVGLYKIKEVDQLLNALENMVENDIRNQGEYQLTQAIMAMIDNNVIFKALEVNNWFDCGKKEVLLETNGILLKKLNKITSVHSPLENSVIIQPVYIGNDCIIKNSIIGPNVSIGDGVEISYSVIKNSIIGSYVYMEEIVLKSSVIGNDTTIKGLCQNLNIGDDTEIDFN
jgi:glucose-1-phosphate thymidylyltransferase